MLRRKIGKTYVLQNWLEHEGDTVISCLITNNRHKKFVVPVLTAADKMNDLDSVAVFYFRLRPFLAANDAGVMLNREPFWSVQTEMFD